MPVRGCGFSVREDDPLPVVVLWSSVMFSSLFALPSLPWLLFVLLVTLFLTILLDDDDDPKKVDADMAVFFLCVMEAKAVWVPPICETVRAPTSVVSV